MNSSIPAIVPQVPRVYQREAVQMFATPAECILKDFVEFGDTGCADHEQSPPHQRTHAAEHYAKLIDRNGRYRRFRHANSLPNPTRAVLNLTPRNLPLSIFLKRILPNSARIDSLNMDRLLVGRQKLHPA